MRGRSPAVVWGAVLPFMLGLLSFVSGIIGFNSPPGSADGITAWPNLITGAVSIGGGVGFWNLKRWSVYVYLIAFAGHVLTQVILYFARNAVGREVPPVTIVFLAVVPLVSLIILGNMVVQRKKGALS